MSNERVTVSGPVDVTSNATARVAFELMNHISSWEEVPADKKNREYWLTLYAQAHSAVSGYSLDSVLKVGK